MPEKGGKRGEKDLPESKWIYRYWVEIRDLRDGSRRELPLSGMTRIHLCGKKNSPPRPNEEFLELKDGSTVIEGKDLDDIAAQLRQKYPDETHERFLREERDCEAERRKAAAMKDLIKLLAQAAVDTWEREQARK